MTVLVLLLLWVAVSGSCVVAARQYNQRARRLRYQKTLANIDRMERELWPEWFIPPRVFGRVRITGTYDPPSIYTVMQSACSTNYVQFIRDPYRIALAPGHRWLVADDSAVAYLARRQ